MAGRSASSGIKKIGSWSIVEVVGKGGQAQVLLGRKTNLNGTTQEAAIKIIPFVGDDYVKSVQLLAHESDVLLRLTNPNIAKVLDGGYEEVDGVRLAWMATELIKGDNLSTEITKFGPLPKQQWLELAFDMFSALAAAHQAGIIHCDIKPGNILRDSRKSVLIDFGFASFVRIVDPADIQASTPGYQAPEQLDDDINPEDYEYPVDLFSLGVTLVEAGTGWLPWDLPTRFRESRKRLEYLYSQKNPGVRQVQAAQLEHQAAREEYAQIIARTAPRLDGLDADQIEIVAPLLRVNSKMRGTAAETLAKIQNLLPEGSSRRSGSVNYEPMRASSPGSVKNQPVKDLFRDAKQEIKDSFQQGYKGDADVPQPKRKGRNYYTAVKLSAFFGIFGVDRFYLGKYVTGFLKLMTFSGLGFWWLWDLNQLLYASTKDKRGNSLLDEPEDKTPVKRQYAVMHFVIIPLFTVIMASSYVISSINS
jgi:serine/threonine protein kinase